MPQDDMELESIGNKTIQGMLIGRHVHAGGFWSRYYSAPAYAPFKQDCDATQAKVKIHRVREVLKQLSGTFASPSPSDVRKRILKGQDFNAPEEMPELAEGDDGGHA